MDDDRLVKQAFFKSMDLARMRHDSWASKVLTWASPDFEAMSNVDYGQIPAIFWDEFPAPVVRFTAPPRNMEARILDETDFIQAGRANYFKWMTTGGNGKWRTKSRDYLRMLRCKDDGRFDLTRANWTTFVGSNSLRNEITRFRMGSHNLEVEVGRWVRVERNSRLCKCCNLARVEDEAHFLFDCPNYDELRMEFNELFLEPTGGALIHSVRAFFENDDMNKLGQYLKRSFRRRTEVLSAMTPNK